MPQLHPSVWENRLSGCIKAHTSKLELEKAMILFASFSRKI